MCHSFSSAGINLDVWFVDSHRRRIGIPVYFYHFQLYTGLYITRPRCSKFDYRLSRIIRPVCFEQPGLA